MGAIENIITENLPIWSSAVQSKSSAGRGASSKRNLYGVKKLRELILDLAVRGLLVPQDPSDESASVLLMRLHAERDLLVTNKIIRKPKVLKDVSDTEFPSSIPTGWVRVRLNDIGDWGAGATPLRSRSEFYGGAISWFKSGELNTDFISHSEETVTELALKESSLRLNKSGDVLLAMYGATIGKASILTLPATTNQAVCACTVFNGVENVFLLTLLKAYRPRFLAMGVGGAQPNISREKIIDTPIALPPLAEQHRIVAKVDELMALCNTLEQQQEDCIQAHETLVEALLEALTSAADADASQAAWQRISEHFDVLFTTEHSIDKLKETILQLAVMGKLVSQDPNDEPASGLVEKITTKREQLVKEGKIKKQTDLPLIRRSEKPDEEVTSWIYLRMADICYGITSGSTPPKDKFIGSGGIPYLKVYNIRDQKIDFAYKPQFICDDYHSGPLKRSILYAGDVVMNIVGPPLGKVAVVPPDYSEWNCNQAITFFRPIHLPMNLFIYTFLLAGEFLNKIDLIGTAGQDNISVTKSRSIVIPVPPMAEQHRIVARVDELMTLCDQLKDSLQQVQQTQIHLTDAAVKNAL